MNKILTNISKSDELPHLLFYGNSGAGKKTRINAILREIYGKKAERVKIESKEIKVGASKSKEITVTMLTSPVHISLNPRFFK